VKSARETQPKPTRDSRPYRARVLLAEDDFATRELERTMLESLGCDVDVASNGREAVLGAASDKYDLILMDCQMPEMDGEQAAAIIRLIRESEQHRKAGNGSGASHVPIVALTAYSSTDSRQRCLDAGMDDFLGKPFEREQLASLVDRWLTRKTRDESAETK